MAGLTERLAGRTAIVKGGLRELAEPSPNASIGRSRWSCLTVT